TCRRRIQVTKGSVVRGGSMSGEVLLNKPRAQVDVDFDEWPVADAFEAVDLPRLDHEDVPRGRLEFLAVDHVAPPTLPDELHFVVGMPVRSRTLPRLRAE